jgi:vacuolar-type H+-ATPase subunit I/STV1
LKKSENSGLVFLFAVFGMSLALMMKQGWYAFISVIVFLLVFGIATILAGFMAIPTIMVVKVTGGTLLTLNCLSTLASIWRIKSNWHLITVEAEKLVEDL